MRFSVVILLVLGVAAAGAAAMLLAASRAKAAPQTSAGADVQIVVAARPLDAFTVVRSDCVTTRTLPAADAPQGCLSDTAHVIGKALRVPMAEGELFTRDCFATDNSPQSVASKLLPPGKRAKAVALSDDAAMHGLLYPGCMVDVLWVFNSRVASNNPTSRTLLENVPVLAVGRETALSSENALEDALSPSSRSRNRSLVTLLVDSQQAEALQLAMDQGSISLALRNPTDALTVAPPPMSLSRLTGESFSLDAAAEAMKSLLAAVGQMGKGFGGTQGGVAPAPAPAPQLKEWETTIIRGGQKTETAKFVIPAAEAPLSPVARSVSPPL